MWFTSRARRERDLDDEIASHLRMAVEDRLAEGDEPGGAQRAARRQFGNVGLVKEATRDVWGWNGLIGMDDLRFAVRRLAKHPAATIVSIGALAVGIGAVAATWSLLSAVILRPLPVVEPEHLVVLGSRGPDRTAWGFIYPVYPFVRDSNVFESTAAEWILAPAPLVGSETPPAPTAVAFVTHNYLDTLGVHLPLGRGFRADEDRQGAALVAVLTDRYWRRAFGASPDVIGRTITVAGKPTTIIGVVSPGFRGLRLPQGAELFMPYHTIADIGSPTTNYLADPSRSGQMMGGTVIVGRLSPGLSGAQAAARLGDLPRPRLVPEGWTTVDVSTFAVPEASRENMGQFARLLAATVSLLLLIGCGAVGMLMLVQAEARRAEFAVCLALGAPRSRLVAGVLLEGAVVSLSGALLALPVANVMFNGMRTFQLPGRIAIDGLPLAIDSGVLAVAATSALLATFLITVVAGAFGFSPSVSDALRVQPGATPRASHRWTRRAVVVGQVAVALVLLVGATLFARSTFAALAVNPGFDASRVLTLTLPLRAYGYSPADAGVFAEELSERLIGDPRIEAVARFECCRITPPINSINIDGVPRNFPKGVWQFAVTPSYFDALGLPVISGRGFTLEDGKGSPTVALVSESLARLLAQDGEALSRRITVASRTQVEVVGVVPDVIRSVAILEPLDIYLPLVSAGELEVLVKVNGDIAPARRDISAVIRSMDPMIAPPALRSIEDDLAREMASQRFGMNVLGGLGAIATLLTLLGMYVLAESTAVQRLREMAIRAALGATPRELGQIVLGDTLRLVGVGILLGLLLVWLGGGLIRSFLFGIQALDTTTLAGVAFVMLMLSLFVSIRPALRLARADLARVLKEE